MAFAPATREKSNLRLALMGVPGAGKTYTAMNIMQHLVGPGFAVIDTEHDSARKYAPLPGEKADPEKGTFDFVHAGITNYDPANYIALIKEAAAAKIPGLVIDSLTHAWNGIGGILDKKDQLDRVSKNSYTNWRDLTPVHNKLIESILEFPGHVIVTFRAKMEYTQYKDDNGKNKVEKLGLGAVQRDDVEYEFDVVMLMDQFNTAQVTKTRYAFLNGQTIQKPGKALADDLLYWLGQGAERPMTREELVQKAAEFDMDEAALGAFLAKNKLTTLQGFNRYTVMYEALVKSKNGN